MLLTRPYPWQEKNWNIFVQAKNTQHLPHALLLTGESGIGKRTLADNMAKSLLCMTPLDGHACNACQSCKTYESGANPDYLCVELLEDKQQIGVDQIRELSEFLNYSRSFNSYRVVLLNAAERMNQNAANSLLKSLEEPSDHTVIILITSQLASILPTIKSRCQLLSLQTPTKKQALNWLNETQGNLKDIELRLNMAYGKPLLAADISLDDIENRNSLSHDILTVVEGTMSAIEVAKKWEKFDHKVLLNWQISWLQALIRMDECGVSVSALNDKIESKQFLSTQAKLSQIIKSQSKWHLYQQLIEQKQLIHTSVNALMFVENMILLWLKSSRHK